MSSTEMSPRITPFLWFDSNADEAVNLYLSVFKNSRRFDQLRNFGDAPGPKGGVLTIAFELDGQRFMALSRKWTNTGPSFLLAEPRASAAG